MLGIGRKSAPALLGIDFGTSTVKGILIARHAQGFKIEGIAEAVTPAGALVDHQLAAPEQIVEALKALKRKFPSKQRLAATAVSGSQVITKIVLMEKDLSEAELEAKIAVESENSIPFPVDEISLDFEVLGVNATDSNRYDVLLSAARTEAVNMREEVLSQAGFETRIVDVESHALGRAWQYSLAYQAPEMLDGQVIGLIDVGETSLNFSILDKGEVVYTRSQNYGGVQYIQQLASHYGLSVDEAKQMVLSGRLPENYELDVYAEFATGIVQHVRRQVSMFLTSSGYKALDALALSGGCTMSDALEVQLQNALKVPVLRADPFAECALAKGIERSDVRAVGGKYMVALGLALRSFDHV